jgi:trans-2,3-dihydro-3-hydroxyanthranilate isomerase
MQRRYVTADVFTDRAFGGNPLAVVLDAEGLSSAQMQAVAREFGYSETTFVLPPADPAHTAHVRIFTPGAELPFAGHPNVGTALVLARRSVGVAPARILFEEAAGLVALDITLADSVPVAAELTAPQPFTRGTDQPAAEVAAAVSLGLSDVRQTAHAPTLGSVGLPFLLIELARRATLRDAAPDARALGAMLSASGGGGLLLYTRDEPGEGCDLQARMFSPLDGIGEDPATGSAICALVALLASVAGAPDLDLALRVGQGVDMGRPSLLLARAVKRGGTIRSAHVGGCSVEMMQGTFKL